jgi:hypothetical protein
MTASTSRRAVLAGAVALRALAGSTASKAHWQKPELLPIAGQSDPVFAAIERHRVAAAAYSVTDPGRRRRSRRGGP